MVNGPASSISLRQQTYLYPEEPQPNAQIEKGRTKITPPQPTSHMDTCATNRFNAKNNLKNIPPRSINPAISPFFGVKGDISNNFTTLATSPFFGIKGGIILDPNPKIGNCIGNQSEAKLPANPSAKEIPLLPAKPKESIFTLGDYTDIHAHERKTEQNKTWQNLPQEARGLAEEIKNALKDEIGLPKYIRNLSMDRWTDIFFLSTVLEKFKLTTATENITQKLVEIEKMADPNIKDYAQRLFVTNPHLENQARRRYFNEIGCVLQRWSEEPALLPQFTHKQQTLIMAFNLCRENSSNYTFANYLLMHVDDPALSLHEMQWIAQGQGNALSVGNNQQNFWTQAHVIREWMIKQLEPLQETPFYGAQVRDFVTKNITDANILSLTEFRRRVVSYEDASMYITAEGQINDRQLQENILHLLLSKNFTTSFHHQEYFIRIYSLLDNRGGMRDAILSIDAKNFSRTNRMRQLRNLSLENVPMTPEGTVGLRQIAILMALITARQPPVGCCFTAAALILRQSQIPASLIWQFSHAIETGNIPFQKPDGTTFEIAINPGINFLPNTISNPPKIAASNSEREDIPIIHNAFMYAYADAYYSLSIHPQFNEVRKLAKTGEEFCKDLLKLREISNIEPSNIGSSIVVPEFRVLYNADIKDDAGHHGAYCLHVKEQTVENDGEIYRPITADDMNNWSTMIDSIPTESMENEEFTACMQNAKNSFKLLQDSLGKISYPSGGNVDPVHQMQGEPVIPSASKPANQMRSETVEFKKIEGEWSEKKTFSSARDAFIEFYSQMQRQLQSFRLLVNSKTHGYTLIPSRSPALRKALQQGMSAEDFLEKVVRATPQTTYFFVDSNHRSTDRPIYYGICYDEKLGFYFAKTAKEEIVSNPRFLLENLTVFQPGNGS
ncbi:MAG: hypothetical protein LBT98_02255 [Puniceicoccales bacterium]|jgi:hypothetical protein|nr:hypothetical protein [Puniceicoccales bacterium]